MDVDVHRDLLMGRIAAAQLFVERRMILRTLEVKKPMTAQQLVNHWFPTWNLVQVQRLLQSLVTDGLVVQDAKGGAVARFALANQRVGNF